MILQDLYRLGAHYDEDKAKEMADYMMKRTDTNNDGHITHDEFMTAAHESATFRKLLLSARTASQGPLRSGSFSGITSFDK